MIQEINKDTILCMSLAGRPGNFGTRFHNFLYRELELNYLYKAFTTNDLPGAIRGIRALSVRGCAISMPFKEVVIELLDELDETAKRIEAVNTIVNSQGHLVGYNTDYFAIRELFRSNSVPTSSRVLVLGSGGMAKAVAAALQELHFQDVFIASRNGTTLESLAKKYGFQSGTSPVDESYDVLINATPMGMHPDIHMVPFSDQLIEKAKIVFDVVANPIETKLLQQAKKLGIKTVSGFEITMIQAREQFILYTGVQPPAELVDRAAAYARNSS
ncbi:MAG: shikimate 5-dehydrogenase [Patescibacteria group bacterium]